MVRRIRWIFSILLICMIVVPIVLYGYDKYQIKSVEKDTKIHLINQGYQEER
ncbi:hypothetical protein [Oceanobacillus iheyensis HTE831]|uniref:Uncharacterized protein n=1 Tax=Oceanobacillus iheyensis (strain DSM 14371 / CIP 107618 / JCM 11309 / KCTC 3954 / HTE831) TaxID=221109 RepID=Q8ESB5_OCEIH|nr:hypothetical protein [Oceanobacillus iheyensis]BAC12682.1 hypothetical protein [Oceanobacillus iheyensis HTE831]